MAQAQKKDKALGVAQEKRRYDLPLNQDSSTGFLRLLVGLMSFLALMALAGFFAMSAISAHWSSGLENKITIEIPATKPGGGLRGAADIDSLSDKAKTALLKNPAVDDARILPANEVQDLISPWLGTDEVLDDIPLPGLIAVDLKINTNAAMEKLHSDMESVSDSIVVDTHEEWLDDILSLAGALKLAAMLVALMIGVTTFAAVAGAIRSRMEVHSEDVELLHLMGANDEYITRQFQRHAFIIALQGSLIGTLAGLCILGFVRLLMGNTAQAMLPDLSLSLAHMIALIGLPLLACVIAAATARFTVLHVLARMP